MSDEISLKRCKQEHCKVHQDGLCMEQLAVEECQNFYLESENSGEETKDLAQALKKNPSIKLYTGEEMSANETDQITHKYSTKMIAIVGESNCGKTTLLAEIYNTLQKGSCQDLLFAGSQTLIGFEKRSHLSKIESNAEDADTLKTNSRDFSFLHLALKRKDSIHLNPLHILLSDIAGEMFQLARDSSSIMQDLGLLKEAEQIIFVIDGELLSKLKKRPVTISNADMFIQRALDNGIFDKFTNLKVIISKWDKLEGDGTFNFVNQIEEPFANKFSSRVNSFSVSKVAARPKDGTTQLPAGYGLYDLLNSCFLVRKEKEMVIPNFTKGNFKREFHQIKVQSENE